MLTRLKNLLNERREGREGGNTLVFFIFLLPVILGAAGTAMDLSLATYVRGTLQSTLDVATQTTLASASNPGTEGSSKYSNGLYLKDTDAYRIMYKNYDDSRVSLPLICQNVPNVSKISPDQNCGYTILPGSQRFGQVLIDGATFYELRIGVGEISSPIFIQILGFEEIKHQIYSDSRITTGTEGTTP